MAVRPSFLRFKNLTFCNVEVIWNDPKGNDRSYGILPPNKFLDINTFSTHTWIFKYV